MPVGHAEPVNPVVSVDLTGMNANTDQISQASVNPAESDQLGGEKRPCADHHIASNVASKRPRTSSLIGPELDFQEDTNSDLFDDELFSPNSRWEASQELSTFLNTASKRLNRVKRRSLVKTFPRPDVDCIYTPSLDQYLKPFVQGVAAPDKPLKELQDKVLDILGPLSTIYENLWSMFHTMEKDSAIELDKESVSMLMRCIKHAMHMTGDVSTHLAGKRRELVLQKINPLLTSLANEEFTDTKRQLFGPGFEQRLKIRPETAETIGKASKVGKPFFRGAASRGSFKPCGGQMRNTFQSFQTYRPTQPKGPRLFNRGAATHGRGQFPRFQSPCAFRPNLQ